MTNDAAQQIQRMASDFQAMADIARGQSVAFTESMKAARYLGWERFIELSQKGRSLALDSAANCDALAGELSALADRVESERS